MNSVKATREVWKEVIGYADFYKVSNQGVVKSLDREVRHWQGGFKKLKGRAMESTVVNGYHQIDLSKDGKVERFLIHRLVAKAFIDNEFDKPQVNHVDGNKLNNNSENLEWVTASENVSHAYEVGLSKRMKGILNGHAILTESDVLKIRKEYSLGHTQLELSNLYGVETQTIQSIVDGRSWRRLDGPSRDADFTRSSTGYKWVERIGDKFRGKFVKSGKRFDCGLHHTAKDAHEAVLDKKREISSVDRRDIN